MKVHSAVALVGSGRGFVLPAFADEAPTAASSTQDAIPVDSDGPTGHPAIKDHHGVRAKVPSLWEIVVQDRLDRDQLRADSRQCVADTSPERQGYPNSAALRGP